MKWLSMVKYNRKTIMMTEDLQDKLSEFAKRNDINESQAIRRALKIMFGLTLGDLEDTIKQPKDKVKK